jgi:hypothetical protein
MTVGFTWGGWVTGGTAREMADGISDDAVVRRLAPMCVGRFKQDVKKQGWATRPGEPEPDAKVADECVKLLMSMS